MDELDALRSEINEIDAQMAALFERRMQVSCGVAEYKRSRGLPVKDAAREAAMLESARERMSDDALKTHYTEFLKNIIEISCRYQRELLNTDSITLELGDKSYDIHIGEGYLNKAGQLLKLDRRVLIVTDSGVPAEYAERLAVQCKEPHIVTIPSGESSKSKVYLEKLISTMLTDNFSRVDCVAAVGGGVVGDLSGFAAACYMRGIDFYNIPTTLLSQVDSSIGGKTAIDYDGLKNVVGAIYQPRAVIVDPLLLSTLDDRQLHAGLAEAIKMAATSDAELFALIENSTNLRTDLPEIIRRSLLIKKAVVETDAEERGLRRVLNFGHTIGHAVESRAAGAMLHGECVAAGMPPMCGDNARARIVAVLKKYDLPYSINTASAEILPLLAHDKKMLTNSIRTVVVNEIGSFEFVDMTPEELAQRAENQV